MGRLLGARSARAALAGAAVCLLLAGCGDDAADGSTTDPVEVEVGKEFTWNDFTVEDGWELTTVKRTMGVDEFESPTVTGSIVNNSEEERAPVFQMVLSLDGDEKAAMTCSSMKLAQDQSGAFECPGLGAVMPKDYDTVTVRAYVRDGGSDDAESDSGA
jgi:hypothetical protein